MPKPLYANYLPFFTGEVRCKIILACTITDVWLIDCDLARVIPVMITRMIISLKKVASSGQPHASTDVLQSGLPTNLRDIYSFRPTDSMQLSVFKN